MNNPRIVVTLPPINPVLIQDMKKITVLLTFCAIVLLSGCEKLEDRNGNVGYNYYTLVEEGGDETDAQFVTAVYEEQFSLLGNAEVKNGYVYMNGRYGDLDKQILEACHKAEEQISATGFKPEKKCTFTVNAIYTMEVVANFYVKAY